MQHWELEYKSETDQAWTVVPEISFDTDFVDIQAGFILGEEYTFRLRYVDAQSIPSFWTEASIIYSTPANRLEALGALASAFALAPSLTFVATMIGLDTVVQPFTLKPQVAQVHALVCTSATGTAYAGKPWLIEHASVVNLAPLPSSSPTPHSTTPQIGQAHAMAAVPAFALAVCESGELGQICLLVAGPSSSGAVATVPSLIPGHSLGGRDAISALAVTSIPDLIFGACLQPISTAAGAVATMGLLGQTHVFQGLPSAALATTSVPTLLDYFHGAFARIELAAVVARAVTRGAKADISLSKPAQCPVVVKINGAISIRIERSTSAGVNMDNKEVF